jgi:hypothetical protein
VQHYPKVLDKIVREDMKVLRDKFSAMNLSNELKTINN